MPYWKSELLCALSPRQRKAKEVRALRVQTVHTSTRAEETILCAATEVLRQRPCRWVSVRTCLPVASLQAVEVIRSTTEELIARCKAMVDAEEMARAAR